MTAPTSARVLGFCGLAASITLIAGCVAGAGVIMAAANVYALVRG